MKEFKKIGEIHHREHPGSAGDMYQHTKTGKFHHEGAAGDGPSEEGHDSPEHAMKAFKRHAAAFNERESDMSPKAARLHAEGFRFEHDKDKMKKSEEKDHGVVHEFEHKGHKVHVHAVGGGSYQARIHDGSKHPHRFKSSHSIGSAAHKAKTEIDSDKFTFGKSEDMEKAEQHPLFMHHKGRIKEINAMRKSEENTWKHAGNGRWEHPVHGTVQYKNGHCESCHPMTAPETEKHDSVQSAKSHLEGISASHKKQMESDGHKFEKSETGYKAPREDNDMHDIHVHSYKTRHHHVEVKSNRAGSSHEAHVYPRHAKAGTHDETDVLHVSGPHKTAEHAADAANKWSRENHAAPMKKHDLTEKGRDQIKEKNFALPEQRKYPIEDKGHAEAALARVKQHGTPEQQKEVAAKVHEKYPGMQKDEGAPKGVGASVGKQRHQKGVHYDTGVSDSASKSGKYKPEHIKGGISAAGMKVRQGDIEGAKEHHHKHLGEQKYLPKLKPKLTKEEVMHKIERHEEPKGDQHHTVAWVDKHGNAQSKHFSGKGHLKAALNFHNHLESQGIKNVEHYPVGYQDEE